MEDPADIGREEASKLSSSHTLCTTNIGRVKAHRTIGYKSKILVQEWLPIRVLVSRSPLRARLVFQACGQDVISKPRERVGDPEAGVD